MPTFVAWEQVPAVIPVWEACGEVLRKHGYTVSVDYLWSEQFAVPQVRKRAILVARLDGGFAQLPNATHSRFNWHRLGEVEQGLMPYVTMHDALGWGMTHRPYPTIAVSRKTG